MKFIVNGKNQSNREEEKEGKKLKSKIRSSQSIEEVLKLMD